jgi:hypothetical protein
VVAVLAFVEAAGVGWFAVRFLIDVLPLEDPWLMRAGYAFGLLACVVGAAVVLVIAGRAIGQLRPWSRSLLVVAQCMALAIGVPMAQGSDWVGWVIAAMGVVGLILLLHPATTAALVDADRAR